MLVGVGKSCGFHTVIFYFIRLYFIFNTKVVWNTPWIIFLGLRLILNGCFIKVLRLNYYFDFRKLLQPAEKLLLQKNMLIIRGIKQAGALPQTPLHFLSWHKKRSKKSQDFARLTQKIIFVDFANARHSSSKLGSALA